MDRLIKEQLESLVQDTATSKRFGRRILNLASFLCPAAPPESIREQLNRLSRLVVLQDAFDALLEPVTHMARSTSNFSDFHAIQSIIASLEQARQSIADIDGINYAELIAWLVNLDQQRKIVRIKAVETPA